MEGQPKATVQGRAFGGVGNQCLLIADPRDSIPVGVDLPRRSDRVGATEGSHLKDIFPILQAILCK